MDPLDQKLLEVFPGKVVRKDLVAPLRSEYHVPSYVVEFLLGRYCSSADEEVIRAGLAEVQKTLTGHFVRSEKAPEIQAIIRDRGRYTIIDKVKARLDPRRNVYWADLVQLRVTDATIPEEYPQKKYRRLLTAGIWSQVEIAYLPENEVGGVIYPFAILATRERNKQIAVFKATAIQRHCCPTQRVRLTSPACLAGRAAGCREPQEPDAYRHPLCQNVRADAASAA